MGHLLLQCSLTYLAYLQRRAWELEEGWTGMIGWSRSTAVSERWVHAHTSSKRAHTHTQIHTQNITDKWPFLSDHIFAWTELTCLLIWSFCGSTRQRAAIVVTYFSEKRWDELQDHFLKCLFTSVCVTDRRKHAQETMHRHSYSNI